MISLGPLSSTKHCPYSCLFCYVPNGFLKYASLDIREICCFLEENKDKYKIIYISGDTDSFAPPRLQKGLALLETVASEFSKDILITTRISMDANIIGYLNRIKRTLAEKGKNLFICISISSPVGDRRIEPLPIPSIESRIETLTLLKKNGFYSILALRPFLPIYYSEDYFKIIDLLKDSVDAILGEVWYHDVNHKMWYKLTNTHVVSRGVSRRVNLPFNISEIEWEEWNDPQMENDIENRCKALNIPFYMNSTSAIDYLQTNTVNNVE
jgi:DNA repair photolyase